MRSRNEKDIDMLSHAENSVTRLGDFLHFGHLFKYCGNNYFAQIAHILGNSCKGVKIFHFLVESYLGNFFRHLATFYGSHWLRGKQRNGGQASKKHHPHVQETDVSMPKTIWA